jgi:hypothetical protein
MAQKAFAEKHMPNDDYVNIVWKVFEVAPKVLGSLGKVSNPWPNVDAHIRIHPRALWHEGIQLLYGHVLLYLVLSVF